MLEAFVAGIILLLLSVFVMLFFFSAPWWAVGLVVCGIFILLDKLVNHSGDSSNSNEEGD